MAHLNNSNNISPISSIGNHIALFLLSFTGIFINVISGWNLSRQEFIRQWYFAILPEDRYPVMPPPEWKNFWKKNTITSSIDSKYENEEKVETYNYASDYLNGMKKISPETYLMDGTIKKLICKFGTKGPGYCKLWVIFFIFLGITFFGLTIIAVIL